MPTSIAAMLPYILGGAAVGSLLDKPDVKAPAPPAIIPPVEMPDPQAQQGAMRRKASIMGAQQMTRASTVLTGSPTAEKLG